MVLNKKSNSILVTGGAGFIGSNIVEKLLNEKNKVIVFDNFLRGKKNNFDNKNIKIIDGDIRKINDLDKIKTKIDTVIHLAYLNGTKYFYDNPDLVLDIGIKGLVNIFDYCKRKKIKNLILFSSSEVYQNPTKIPTTEMERMIIPNPFNPRYSYSAGKIITEIMGINYAKFFKKLIIIRPHNVYGPNMGKEHVIPEIIMKFNKLKNKKIVKIIGDGTETRSFIYISDFVDAFYRVLIKGKHKNIYNLGNNEEISIKNLTKKIGKLFNKDFKIQYLKGHLGNTPRRCPSIIKIKKLGYKQNYSIEKGLKLTINSYLNSL